MNLIDLEFFDSCAFMLSAKGEWLAENYLFSNNVFFSSAKNQILNHLNSQTNHFSEVKPIFVGGKWVEFKIVKGVDDSFIVFCSTVISNSVADNKRQVPLDDEFIVTNTSNSPNGSDSTTESDIFSLFSSISDGLLLVNKAGCIELLSDQVERFFPYIYVENYIGKPILNLVTEIVANEFSSIDRDPTRVLSWFKFKILKGKAIDFIFKTRNGMFVEYRDRVSDNGGRIGLLVDETRKYKVRGELKKDYTKMLQLSKVQSDFIATLGHEIRTPLNAVIGLIELSLGGVSSHDKTLLSAAFSTSRQVLSLINNMLDLKKVKGDDAGLNKTSIDIRSLAERIIEVFSIQAEKKSIKLDFFMPLSVNKNIICDEVKLNQVLYNLMGNSIKFSNKKDPFVLLLIEDVEQSFDKITLKFTVVDNGIGLTHEQQSRIFNKYEQASSEIYEKYGGTGLGLYISSEICKKMGSEIKVVSSLGKGSAFYFVAEFLLDMSYMSSDFISDGKYSLINNKAITCYTNNYFFSHSMKKYSSGLGLKVIYLSNEELLKVDSVNSVFIVDVNQGGNHSEVDLLSQLSTRNETVAELRGISSINIPSDYEIISYPPVKIRQVIDFINGHCESTILDTVIADAHDYGNINILVIDDCKENLFVIDKQLTSIGVKVACIQDSMQAIELFKVNKYNLVISDVMMPDISGADLVSVIRDIEKYKNLTPAIVIMLTGDDGDLCKESCLKAGADRVLVKPLVLADLVSLLDEVNDTLSGFMIDSSSQDTRDSTVSDDFFCIDNDEADTYDATQCDPSAVHPPVNVSEVYKFVGDISDEELDLFLDQYYSNLLLKYELLKSAVIEKDTIKINAISHTLKSNSLFVGARSLNLACQRLEDASSNKIGDYEELVNLWHTVESDLLAVIAFFAKRSDAHGQE
ncbi:ATP-binding protein [Shewanella profunda]|uniref:hybrid sensor histidine kinase/response regulator n=1 Tax=Shewanella profunda TaxID=254793 RepID=UPI00201087DB|nr:ATP-binding protein [Shewanella profunda]MCL1089968.1 ATP-binding protein [Shewanella profunda]